jgi:hypothetical protein
MLKPETAWRSEWLDADEYPPPTGKKIMLLTDCGIACIGHWYQPGFIAWSPLPKIPKNIKSKLDKP